MPFFLYSLNPERDKLTRLRPVSLAGKLGPIAEIAREKARRGGGWHAPEKQLLVAAEVRPDGHALVIDLKPRDKKAAHLYRVRNVWGFSHGVWMPLLLQLEKLYGSKDLQADPAKFKECFPVPEQGEIVHEFLYVNGGHEGGPWTWGMVGQVNGALLYSDALEYFLKILSDGSDAPAPLELAGASVLAEEFACRGDRP